MGGFTGTSRALAGGWLLAVLALAGCGGGNEVAPSAAAPLAALGDVKQAQAYRSATNFSGNGWYWNPAEPGTGLMFEAQGEQAFAGFFLYEAGSGKPVWYAAYGAFFVDDAGEHHFSGDLRRYRDGQSISATTVPAGNTSVSMGAVSIRFSTTGAATVLLPGGRNTVQQRFDFNGLGGTARADLPETGWYWNPAEGGRGYALEVQNGRLYLAMFHYDEAGEPTWNIVQGDLSDGTLVAPFETYDGGQSLTAAFRPGGERSPRGRYSVSFRNACAGEVQRAGVAPVTVRRFPIPGSGLAPGAECRALATSADAPNPPTPLPNATAVSRLPVLLPGHAVFSRIDVADDVDTHAVPLTAGVTYRFAAQGASSRSGSHPDPRLQLIDAATGLAVAANDDEDRAAGRLDASFDYTPATSGTYLLVSAGASFTTGSLVLSVRPTSTAGQVSPLSSRIGAFQGRLRGDAAGSFTLLAAADGSIGGSVTTTPGGTRSVAGLVQANGQFRLAGNAINAAGYIGPQGDLSGTWSTGTGGGVLIGDRSDATVLANRAPTASVYASPTAQVGPLRLAGYGNDPDGDPLSYRWRIVSVPPNSTARLTGEQTQAPVLEADVPGDYVVALVVSDGKIDGAAAQATVRAVLGNAIPRADAGPSRSVAVGSVVALDGSASTDADSRQLRYRWKILQQPAASTQVVDPTLNQVRPSFTATHAGVYVLQLQVADELSASTTEISITAVPGGTYTPIAQAPRNVYVPMGSSVRLSGLVTSVVPTTSTWQLRSRPPGSAAALATSAGREADLTTDLPGDYRLDFDVREFSNVTVGSTDSTTVVALDLASGWGGYIGVDETISSTHFSMSTTSSGALTGVLELVTPICDRSRRLSANFVAPVRLFDAGGNTASFTFTDGSTGLMSIRLLSPTLMEGTLAVRLADSPSCGAVAAVLPFTARRDRQ